MEGNALANLGTQVESGLSNQVFTDITKVGDYLPPIRLMQKGSEAVGDETIGIKVGEFLWDMNKILGKSVNCIPIAYRPHAMFIDKKVVQEETFKVDDTYRKIQGGADAKPKVKGMLAGLDFLMYVPGKGFGVYFLYGTAKRCAPDIKNKMHQPITVQGKYVKTTEYDWWTPEIVPCTATLALAPEHETDLQTIVDKFLNPSGTSVGQTANADGSRER